MHDLQYLTVQQHLSRRQTMAGIVVCARNVGVGVVQNARLPRVFQNELILRYVWISFLISFTYTLTKGTQPTPRKNARDAFPVRSASLPTPSPCSNPDLLLLKDRWRSRLTSEARVSGILHLLTLRAIEASASTSDRPVSLPS